MRAIVFRAKDDEGRWRRGFILPFGDGVGLLYERDPEDPTICGVEGHFVDQETVGQYTGIADSQANPIFEGDIIEVTLQHNKQTESTYKAVVEQKQGAYGFGNKQGFAPFYGQIYETFKVIGNIHDNPELMKGVEK